MLFRSVLHSSSMGTLTPGIVMESDLLTLNRKRSGRSLGQLNWMSVSSAPGFGLSSGNTTRGVAEALGDSVFEVSGVEFELAESRPQPAARIAARVRPPLRKDENQIVRLRNGQGSVATRSLGKESSQLIGDRRTEIEPSRRAGILGCQRQQDFDAQKAACEILAKAACEISGALKNNAWQYPTIDQTILTQYNKHCANIYLG